MANETGICNMALSLLGDKRIATFGDTDTKEGRYTNLFYAQSRDEVFAYSGVNWRIASERAGPLAAVTGQPSFGWDYAYQVPTNPKCLRVISLINDSQDALLSAAWKREGDYILTDEDEVYILYVKQVTDPSKFPPLLVHAIYLRLAAKMAIPLIGGSDGRKLSRSLLEEYQMLVLPSAVAANAAEGFVSGENGKYDWTDAGRS